MPLNQPYREIPNSIIILLAILAVTTMGINVKDDSVFLGLDSDSVCQFALEIPGDEALMEKLSDSNGRFLGVRKSLFLLSNTESSITSQVNAVNLGN